MSSAAEQFSEICKANWDAARQFAAFSLDGAENIFNVQLRAAREVLVKDSEQLSALWLGNSLSKALTAWPELYQNNTQKALDAARAYMDSATKAQSEFARLFQDQVAVANLTVSKARMYDTAARAAIQTPDDVLGDQEAQGRYRIGHVTLRATGCRAACNLWVGEALLVERRFFWSRHA